MPLSQKQLDKIIKPGEVGTHSTVGDALDKVDEPALLSSSILTEDKSFSSAASPINSLLAGEKIQFGAVTSPSVLPNSSYVSHGTVPPGSCHSRAQVSNEVLSAADNSCSLSLGKEKKSSESCADLEDCESEVEAAASAIAVAAITSDEIIGNDLGAGSSSCAEAKTFGSSDVTAVRAGVSQTTSSTENSKHFPVTSDEASTQLPDEQGLASSTGANSAPTMGQSTVASAATTDDGKKHANQYGGGNTGSSQNNSSSFSSHSVLHKNASAQSYGNSSGYNYQRGGKQKNGSEAKWSNQRTVFK